jgi:hypothetical protein
MENKKIKGIAAGALVIAALGNAGTANANELFNFSDLGNGSTLRSELLSLNALSFMSNESANLNIEAGCGKASTTTKGKEAKCGEKGKEGKCGEKAKKGSSKGTKTSAKGKEAKCGEKGKEGKCGEKGKEAKCGEKGKEGKCGEKPKAN